MQGQGFQKDFLSLTNQFWKLKDFDEREAENISQNSECSYLLAKLFSIRKINFSEIEAYTNPSLKEYIPDPYKLIDMEKACSRIYDSIAKKEKIAVFGDYDVDGSTSTSTIVNYFKAIGITVDYHIPNRFTEGYGPNKDIFSKFKENGVKIIFTVDCGTTSYDEMDFAKKENLDVIILDHHQSEIKLPEAYAIINPNRLDDTSQLNYLAAVGVTYMFLIGINRKLRSMKWFEKNKIQEPNLIGFLDIVALGTICDAVPLKGINRLLVLKGIEVMKKQLNIGLKSLIEKSSIKGKISTYDLGFKLGPRINAAGRLGRSSFGTELLTATDKIKADKIANELDKFNQERRTIESYVLDSADQQVTEEKLKNRILIVSGENWHEGVIGIIASRLKDKYQRPCIVISIIANNAKGSGRSVKEIDLGSLIIAAKQSGVIKSGGGHSMAAGLTLDASKINELSDFLEDKLSKYKYEISDKKTIYVDSLISSSGINLEVYDEVEKLGPFGSDNIEPTFVVRNSTLASISTVGENHLKCLIRNADGSFIEAMAFRSLNTQLGEEIQRNKGNTVSLLGKIKVNEWGGRRTPQFHIEDIGKHID
jgi:single-stranded-DNA-specific exonuclease